MPRSYYAVIRVGSPIRDEWTNIGIAVYDSDYNYYTLKLANLRRALIRGDIAYEDTLNTQELISEFITFDRIANPSMEWQLSNLQFGKTGMSPLPPDRLIDDIWHTLIKGCV